MSKSQARNAKLPKQFPFAKRGKELIPEKFNIGYHVDVLGKYSKKIPKRQPSAVDRGSFSTVQWMNDTRKFDPIYYKAH